MTKHIKLFEQGEWVTYALHPIKPIVIRPERPNILAATTWLKDYLANGPRRSQSLFVDACNAGHTDHAIKKAAKQLRVKAYKLGVRDGWAMRLPNARD